jgi:BASS family bile acid:Na+ symporter
MAIDLQRPVKIALIALALSPLPPVLPTKQLKAGGGLNYVTGLLFGTAMVSLVTAPLGLLLVDLLSPADLQLGPEDILPPIVTGIALPLILGIFARRLQGDEWADRWSAPIAKAATIVMGIVFLVLLVVLAPAMWQVLGDGTAIALGVMIAAGMAAGWMLGGNAPGEKAALALAASSRHPGVAIAIAATNFPNEKLAPAAILVGLLLSVALSIPFMRHITSASPVTA